MKLPFVFLIVSPKSNRKLIKLQLYQKKRLLVPIQFSLKKQITCLLFFFTIKVFSLTRLYALKFSLCIIS